MLARNVSMLVKKVDPTTDVVLVSTVIKGTHVDAMFGSHWMVVVSGTSKVVVGTMEVAFIVVIMVVGPMVVDVAEPDVAELDIAELDIAELDVAVGSPLLLLAMERRINPIRMKV